MAADKLAATERQRIADSNIVAEPTPERVANITVDIERLRQAMKDIAILVRTNNAIAGNALELGHYSVQNNRCFITVADEISAEFIQKDKQRIVEELRSRLREPAIVVEVITDSTLVVKVANVPYTLEEKIRVMQEKNPVLLKLQEQFKTRIVS
jgi:hypothetical protein